MKSRTIKWRVTLPYAGPWGKGRVTLVGDAAHAMHPTSGQGFAQAAEDAHALAVAVRDGGVSAEALRAFEESRWERAARVGDTEKRLSEAAYNKQGAAAGASMGQMLDREGYIAFLNDPRPTPL